MVYLLGTSSRCQARSRRSGPLPLCTTKVNAIGDCRLIGDTQSKLRENAMFVKNTPNSSGVLSGKFVALHLT